MELNRHTNYLLEELKQSYQRLEKLEDIQFSLTKFYFAVIFSLGTAVIALYNYGIFTETDILVPWFILLPLLIFGYVVYYCLKKIIIERDYLEHTRNEIAELFLYGELKHQYKLFRSPLMPFYRLVSWMVTINFFAFIYVAFPFFRETKTSILLTIIISIIVALIMFSIVLVSLGGARLKAKDARRKADIRMLQTALELFYADNNKYPITSNIEDLNESLSNYLESIPIDPSNKDEFKYSYESADGRNYKITYTLEEKKQKITTTDKR